MSIPGARRFIAIQLFGAVAIAAYWALWFGGGRHLVATLETPAFYSFENAFPLADAWLGFASVCGAVSLWRRRSSALFWVPIAASSSLFLGLIDLLFDLQNGVFSDPLAAGVVVEALIVALALGIGIAGLQWTWKHRHALLALESGG